MSFEWELSKENVRPLKQGRNMDTLNAALGQQKQALHRSLEAQRAEYEKQLTEEAGDSDEPVPLYQNYVSWVEQAYPSGNRRPLIEALEKSIRALADNKGDIRCLKLWLKYIDLMGDAVKQIALFEHLQSSQYFQDLALFYEAWAALLESLQRHKDAEEIYKQGLQRKAKPVSRLERHHKEFEQRVMAGIARDAKSALSDVARAAQPQRKALSSLGEKAGVVRTGAAVQGPAGVVSVKKSAPSSNARPVVLDENQQPASAKSAQSASHPTNALLAQSDKENLKSAGKWTGSNVATPHAIPFSDLNRAPSSVVVFGEADAAIVHSGIGPETKSVVPASVLRPHKATAAESSGLSSIAKPQSRERPIYPKAQVYTEHGEYSLEEIRARNEYRRYVEEQAQSNEPDAMELTQVVSQPIQFNIDRDTITRLSVMRELTITRRLSFDGLTPELSQKCLSDRPGRRFDWNAPGAVMETVCTSAGNTSSLNGGRSSTSTITPSPAQNSSRDLCAATTQLPTGMVGDRLPLINAYPAPSMAVGSSLQQPTPSGLVGQDTAQLASSLSSSSSSASFSSAVPAPGDASFAGRSASMTYLGPAITPTMTYHTRYAMERMMSAMKSNDIDNASIVVGHRKQQQQKQASNSSNPQMPVTSMGTPLASSLTGASTAPASSVTTAFTTIATMETSSATTVVAAEPEPMAGGGGFTIYDETAESGGFKIFDESAAPPAVDKENSGRVRKPRLNSGLRGLSERDASQTSPLAAAASAEQPSQEGEQKEEREEEDQQMDTAPAWVQSTPGPTSQSIALPVCGLSTIRQPHRLNDETDCDDLTAGAWGVPGAKKQLTPIREELSRTGSSLSSSRSGSIGSNSSRITLGATIPSSQHVPIKEEPMEEQAMQQPDQPAMPTPTPAPSYAPDESVVNGLYTGDLFSPAQHAQWIERMGVDFSSCPGYRELSQQHLPDVSEKYLGKAVILDEDDQTSVFVLKSVLGRGAFSTAYSANHVAQCYDKDNEDIVAVKVTEQPDIWEFLLSFQMPLRIANGPHPDTAHYFITMKQCFHYANGTCAVMEQFKCTLLDIVNLYKSRHQDVPHVLALYYTWHMLKAVEAMHWANYLHADIKPDNFVISAQLPALAVHLQGADSNFLAANLPEVLTGVKAIHLIDYGRAVDLSCLPAGTAFTTPCDTEDFCCVEMLENRPWCQQIDTFGVIGTAHVLLNGDYMKVTKTAKGTWYPTRRPKRYWNPIWEKMYSELLNIPNCQEQPDLAALRLGVQKALEADVPALHKAIVQQHQLLSTV